MRKQLADLRRIMKEEGIDAYLVPTTDFHGSEYVNPYFRCREYISGFDGSAGTLLVTEDGAGLWTDGRYFLQAGRQLAESGITLMKDGEEGVPSIMEFLREKLSPRSCLAFDGRVVNYALGEQLEKICRIKWTEDLVQQIWPQRPALEASRIYPLPQRVTGESTESKIARIREYMMQHHADMHLMTAMEDIAWIYNLRGNDVECTPVFFSFLLIMPQGERLYVLDQTLADRRAEAELPETTEIRPYFDIFRDLGMLPEGKLLLCLEEVSYAMVKTLPDKVKLIDDRVPARNMKAIKNSTEIRCTRNAHVKDGAAMVKFIKWLKEKMDKAGRTPEEGRSDLSQRDDCSLTEISAADYLKKSRSAMEGFNDLSFSTISGYGANGAVVHYDPTPETDAILKPQGFLLVDSGGQYCDGTTDITRTIALGPLSLQMKKHYTLVLKSHLALASARFSPETTGRMLDAVAREPLNKEGLDYKHGTGHGVGHILSVHEGPNKISPLAGEAPIVPGMITTDEPGLYLEGKYGIRLENELLCVSGDDGLLEFEPLTWCPWEREAIITEMLSDEELSFLNEYHRKVRENLTPVLDRETACWLEKETEEITRI